MDILSIVSVFYNDGVVIDSLEIAPHSRRLPNPQRRYVNLCDIMIAFAVLYGFENFGDSFIGLEPKTGLRRHYIRKYKAQPMGVLYGIDPIVTSKLVRLYYI